MKECPICKTKNQNNAAFCTGCGTNLRDVPSQADEWAAAAGSIFDKAKDAASAARGAASTGAERVQKAIEAAERRREAARAAGASSDSWSSAAGGRAPRGGNMFVDQGESAVSTIGNSYLQNFLLGGSVRRGVGILTEKRFYYKGKNFSTEKGGGFLNALKKLVSITEEGVVSIDDISFTRFTFTRHTGLLLLAILFTMTALSLMSSSAPSELAAISFVAALIFCVLYFIRRETLFMVFFPGGGFGFNVKYYPIADIRDFQRQLHLLKDYAKRG